MSATGLTLRLRAPAKLNLALRVVERRPDGYHELQTLFQLIDLCDRLTLTARTDGQLRLHTRGHAGGLPKEPGDNLAVKAALLLRERLPAPDRDSRGADIVLHKRIPVAAGLGGGSSDAACVLLGLNRLWATRLDRNALMRMALRLGADVPVFIFGRNAFAEGIGEQLTEICLPCCHYLVVTPPVTVSTARMFASLQLTEGNRRATISAYLHDFSGNDFEQSAVEAFPVLRTCQRQMSQLGKVQLSGTGASLFIRFADKQQARQAQSVLAASLPADHRLFCAAALAASPAVQQLHPARTAKTGGHNTGRQQENSWGVAKR